MISEARRLHPPMIAVGAVFIVGFLFVVIATVFSVLARRPPDPADVDALPLPPGLETIDSHPTCSVDACDGEGAVVAIAGQDAATVVASIEGALAASGDWVETDCPVERTCFRSGEVRAVLARWADVDDPATSPIRNHLDDVGMDQTGFAYVRVHRCGIVADCD